MFLDLMPENKERHSYKLFTSETMSLCE
uniref:Uncharacterized protein n=1 Tax=Anguilla anguilla TaxID=7936 RepID=A0A0E9V679_ANGAN